MKSKEEILRNSAVVCVLALLCCALWGSAFPCIKIGYKLVGIGGQNSGNGSRIMYAGLRFILAGIMVIIVGSVQQKKIMVPKTFSTVKRIFILSLFQTILQYIFFYIGLSNTSGAKASIIEGANVFVAILVSVFMFRQEKLTFRKSIGCLVGFAGVVMANVCGSGGMDFSFKFTGEGYILISTFAYGISAALMKEYSKEDDTVKLSGYQFLCGGIILTISGWLMSGRFSIDGAGAVAMLLYLAFVSAAAYTIWGILLKYNPLSKVAVFGFMNPVFGVILSMLLLSEDSVPVIVSVMALLLVSCGIVIVNGRGKKGVD